MLRNVIFVFFGLLSSITFSQTAFQYELRPNNFRHGEKLVYNIRYGFIHGGQANITLEKVKFKKQSVYFTVTEVKTQGLADRIYKVRDYWRSYFDIETGNSILEIREVNEGDYHFYNETFFYPHDSTVYSKRSDSTFNVPHNITDMMTLFYALRRMNMEDIKPGEYIDIITFFDDEVLPFAFRYKGLEIIDTEFGEFECYKFHPATSVGRAFKTDEDMQVWITADNNQIPIKVRFDLWVGSIKCDLVEHKNLLHPLKPIKD